MENPNIKATDEEGNELTDAQVEVNGVLPDDGGSGTDVAVSDDGTEVVSSLNELDIAGGLSVSNPSSGTAKVDVDPGDDEWIPYGDSGNYRVRYDSTADEWVLQHQPSGNELRFDSAGAVTVPSVNTDERSISNIGCSYELSTTQTIPDNTVTKIEFDSAIYDDRGEFDTSTHEFSPNESGYYAVSVGAVTATDLGDGDEWLVGFNKNGGIKGQQRIQMGSSGPAAQSMSKHVKLGKSDTISGIVRQQSGSSADLGSGASTFIAVSKLG